MAIMRSTPADSARSMAASRSESNFASSRWTWESTSFTSGAPRLTGRAAARRGKLKHTPREHGALWDMLQLVQASEARACRVSFQTGSYGDVFVEAGQYWLAVVHRCGHDHA